MIAAVRVTIQILAEESPTYTRPVWSLRYLLFKQPKLIYTQYLSQIVPLQDDSGSNNNKKKNNTVLISVGTTLLVFGCKRLNKMCD